MRNCTFLILILILCNCTNKNVATQKNDWVKHNLSGRVKSYTELTYFAEDVMGEIKKGKRFEESFGWPPDVSTVFNEEGFITEVTRFNVDSSIYVRSTLLYGKNNQQILRKNFGKDSLLSVIKYRYDKHGDLLESRMYEPSGQLHSVYLSTYDESGYRIEEIVTYPISKETRTNIYTNDKDGHIIEKRVLRPFEEDDITSYKYNDLGHEIQRTEHKDDGRDVFYTFNHNENGDLIESHYKSDNYSTYIKHEYTYDEKGNWVKCLTYEDGMIFKIQERTYIYYNTQQENNETFTVQ